MLNSESFQLAVHAHFAPYKNTSFLLAISGGVDSMVLLHLFKSLGLQCQVAHLNYQLRENDSEEDQKLVERVCEHYNIVYHLYRVSEKDNKPRNSIQDWARNLRYRFFRKIQRQEKLDFIVTAHHLNDQLETFIINLSKAAGINGLSGIPANENQILRPLLGFSKEDIYAYAKENKVEFREDQSNQKNDYLRNKIRNEIVPKLKETNENFLENFGKSISFLNKAKDFIAEKTLIIEKEISHHQEDYLLINRPVFLNQSELIQFEILRKYGFDEVKEIAKIKKAKIGKKFISRDYELKIDRENFVIQKLVLKVENDLREEISLEMNSENEIIIPENFRKEIKELGSISWQIDADKIKFPLKLRQKKRGDLFQPIGMIGKKKISKFFKDEKIPILAQQKIWLLCDGNHSILGILPFRQDGRFAATKTSSKIIKVKL